MVCARQPRAKRFVQKTYAMGVIESVTLDKALSFAYALEDEEPIRKMMLPK